MYDIIFKDIEIIFNLSKLKIDLFKYLDNDNEVWSSHELTGNIKKNVLEKEDLFTIGSIRITKKYHDQIFLPYTVDLIVGEYDNTLGVILVEKFIAEMLYDTNYELITIDFIHNVDK